MTELFRYIGRFAGAKVNGSDDPIDLASLKHRPRATLGHVYRPDGNAGVQHVHQDGAAEVIAILDA